MGLVFGLLLIPLASMAMAVWRIQRTAQGCEAQRATYGWCMVAVLATWIAASGLGVLSVMVLGGKYPLLTIILPVFAVSSFIYTTLLGTSWLRGMWIACISKGSVLAVSLPLHFLVGSQLTEIPTLLEKLRPTITVADVEEAATEVCGCGTDETCLHAQHAVLAELMDDVMTQQERLAPAELDQMRAAAARATQCAEAPRLARDQVMAKLLAISQAQEQRAASQAPNAAPPVPNATTGQYRTITLAEGARYLQQRVRVTRSNGRQYIGLLTAITAEHLTVKQQRYGGFFSITLPHTAVQELQVFVYHG